tara:strand:+ start:2177 stop:2938 length:762 start_codon:yes stop_codon:yes gene_type:complete
MFLNSLFLNKYLFAGDTLVFDRWKWIAGRLPKTNENWKLLDVGCGSGAITLKASNLGYDSIGLTWDKKAVQKCSQRAKKFALKNCKFEVFDARNLKDYTNGEFDVILNTENVEHLIDDLSLFHAMFSKLKKGGTLLLTTPNYYYKSITDSDNGPFSKIEDGWHIRRGYSKEMIKELCMQVGFKVEEISYCSGFLSQKVTFIIRILSDIIGRKMAWLITFPLRIFPILFDKILSKITNYANYSICLVAYKPRFE